VEVRHINRSSFTTHHPKVYTSTNLLCPTASGRVSGVPDVPSIGGQFAAAPLLTAYLTAYGLRKKLRNGGAQGPALNSASVHSVD
jgi:hypothetical protein